MDMVMGMEFLEKNRINLLTLHNFRVIIRHLEE